MQKFSHYKNISKSFLRNFSFQFLWFLLNFLKKFWLKFEKFNEKSLYENHSSVNPGIMKAHSYEIDPIFQCMIFQSCTLIFNHALILENHALIGMTITLLQNDMIGNHELKISN